METFIFLGSFAVFLVVIAAWRFTASLNEARRINLL